MASRHVKRISTTLSMLLAMAATSPALAEPMALVGILQGDAVLIRQTARYLLKAGAALGEGDIVETPAGAFVQIEFDDGAIAGLGEASRLILKPRLSGLKPVASPRLYLLEGWLKVKPGGAPSAEFALLGPRFELNAVGGSIVVRNDPRSYAIFVERGIARLIQRDGRRATHSLKAGEFAAQSDTADSPTLGARASPEFVQKMPRLFRDTLPARAASFDKHGPPLKPIGPIDYADVKAWLHSEPGVRLALSRQWRSRAADRAFRAEVAANLSAHPEWERVIFPERFLPKKPPGPRPAAPSPVASGAGSPIN